jgi:hexosaminidase
MLPTRVDISISEDGQSFTPVLETSVATSKERDPVIKRIETAFEEQWVAFIRISATNRAVLPDWHIREGDAWLFVDEISVK